MTVDELSDERINRDLDLLERALTSITRVKITDCDESFERRRKMAFRLLFNLFSDINTIKHKRINQNIDK